MPRASGSLVVPGLRVPWWDVRSGQAQTARLPDLTLTVGPGNGSAAAVPPPTPVDTREALPGTDDALAPRAAPEAAPRPWGWIAAACGFALLWLLTLWWAWRQRQRRSAPGGTALPRTAAARPGLAQLRQQLDTAGLDEIVDTLAAMGGVQGLQGVLEHLSDPVQRQALIDMQAARWSPQGGNVAQARQALRRAFHDGPHWQVAAATDHTGLAPLYPPGR